SLGDAPEHPRRARRVLATYPVVVRRELQGTAGTRGVGLLFGAVNAGLLGPVEELVARWRPDVVVHEPPAARAVRGPRSGARRVGAARRPAATARQPQHRARARRQ